MICVAGKRKDQNFSAGKALPYITESAKKDAVKKMEAAFKKK